VCRQQTFDFQALGNRRVAAIFTGGHFSRDGGSLLLREAGFGDVVPRRRIRGEQGIADLISEACHLGAHAAANR
jgi:hypothetical protein